MFCGRAGKIEYKSVKPELIQVKYDGKVVATLEVQPGIKEGTKLNHPVFCRQTTARDVTGKVLFEMNKVYLPDDEIQAFYKCCACHCPCFECCKPCRCPKCMPFGACPPCPRCPGCPSCSCNCCAVACSLCCNLCGKCCALCKGPCCKCSVKETNVDNERGALNMPTSDLHKAHRIVYPLPVSADGSDLFGYAAFTTRGSSVQSDRATLAADPAKWGAGQIPEYALAGLPLLIDLAMGSTNRLRGTWTIPSRSYQNLFEPRGIVHYWPKGEYLQTIVANFDHKDFVNPTQGCVEPKQQKME